MSFGLLAALRLLPVPLSRLHTTGRRAGDIAVTNCPKQTTKHQSMEQKIGSVAIPVSRWWDCSCVLSPAHERRKITRVMYTGWPYSRGLISVLTRFKINAARTEYDMRPSPNDLRLRFVCISFHVAS
ncbi:hypothetical protein TEQG_03618 [Trichophyton equinum CBS 127.97]|uniref:Secreted protein n=1 Tax=Trichophyton equinum (strain ATCC MYA-4606 / CBS 127.97) TaxID=559882 RepID=F2PR98_TRIEC|nr:hypothetical protein TEQG_03618 [Trichophyton equinum CBS 127.97]